MALTKKDIEYVASLARIELTEKAKEKYTKELSAILDFVNQLDEAEISGVEPLYQVTGLDNVMRNDGEPYKADEAKINSIIKQAPETEGNFVKVKAVLSKK